MTTLYGTYLSPFVRKVMIALELKGVEYKIHPVIPSFSKDIVPDGVPDDWATLSPCGLIPALRDDRVAVSDSSVICEYLDARYPDTPLTPTDPTTRARCHWYEEYGDTAMTTAMVFGIFGQRVLRKLILKREPDEKMVQVSIEERVPKVCDYLERELVGKKYLLGDSPTIADISVVNPMINMHYGEHSVDAKRWTNLSNFYKRMTSMPVIAKIIEKEEAIIAASRN